MILHYKSRLGKEIRMPGSWCKINDVKHFVADNGKIFQIHGRSVYLSGTYQSYYNNYRNPDTNYWFNDKRALFFPHQINIGELCDNT